jgi:catechol 2,3-dioxygenase-like lactoylglutathione lyase family enzyme
MKLHLSLNVSDLARSVAFYESFLGTPPHKLRPGYANFDLEEPPLKLALNEYPAIEGRGALNHLGLMVSTTGEAEAAKERLIAAGLATFDEADTVCCYARQYKIWVHDPDGNAWEVYALTDDMTDEHDLDHAGNPTEEGAFLPLTALAAPAPRRVPCCSEDAP